MPINLAVPQSSEMKPRIAVFGVGGAGGNAVNNMITADLGGVEFVVANTDAQAIGQSKAERRIQLGTGITEGLGAGSQPEIGRAAAEESLEEILEQLMGAHMVFITAGMGGGTGTGAAPVIARAARERDILTVGVVTKPFHFEGARRMRVADSGIEELQKYVDTLLIIPNQNLFRVADEKTTFAQAFSMADDVLHSGVRGITDLMVMPGLINLDFADVRTVMNEMGKAMMGTGEAEGDKRAIDAAEAAISNPLLDETSMKGARGVLINITGGLDMTLFEVDESANRIRSEVDPDANIIVGSTFDEKLDGKMRVSVVATGIEVEAAQAPQPSEKPAEARAAAVQTAPWRRQAAAAATPAAAENADGIGVVQTYGAPANPVGQAQAHLRDEIQRAAPPAAASFEPTQPTAAAVRPTAQPAPAPQSAPPPRTNRHPLRAAAPGGQVVQPQLDSTPVSEEAEVVISPTPEPQTSEAERPLKRQRRIPIFGLSKSGDNAIGGFARDVLLGRSSAEETRGEEPPVEQDPVTAPAQGQGKSGGDDLFGGSSDDEQLEIPAFLRR